ncbi:MAG: GDP-mannose 4,6-dehydratase [Alphaproteobacteria bacterium]|nr:GDP-mannose 4,6-dehydratase [Alphaproteobacteria bacterium]
MHRRKAFVTGVSGQDGAYLAQFLLNKDYEVHGLVRWDSCMGKSDELARFEALGLDISRVHLHFGDLIDAQNITALIKEIQPEEIYNLAAMSQVAVSFDTPASAIEINTKGVLAVLEAVRLLDMEERVRIYQASSSEMFGSAAAPQNEETPMHPCSPYGAAKLAAYWLVKTYRDSYGIHASNGILFNHESPVRGEDFVTRKITRAVVEIEKGRCELLMLGNLDSVRDWGHARDYVAGMWAMLQQNQPGDYVLATGEAKTVREFVTRAFSHIGVRIGWRGCGIDEVGFDKKTGRTLVQVDPALFRPKDVNYLLGDASKAKAVLGWQPECYFDDLISEMMNADRQEYYNCKQNRQEDTAAFLWANRA